MCFPDDRRPTGGDASRTVSSTYNSHDLLATYTDAAGANTKYAYDATATSAQTDPSGNVTDYAYDADGRLNTTLDNYTGDPARLPAAAPGGVVPRVRPGGPDGLGDRRDGRITAYGYTDNGLVGRLRRNSPGGGRSHGAANSYDAAGEPDRAKGRTTATRPPTTRWTPRTGSRSRDRPGRAGPHHEPQLLARRPGVHPSLSGSDGASQPTRTRTTAWQHALPVVHRPRRGRPGGVVALTQPPGTAAADQIGRRGARQPPRA